MLYLYRYKITDFYKSVNMGMEITVSASSIVEVKKCADLLEPTQKKIYRATADFEATEGYMDCDADLALPFTMYSSEAGADFGAFKEKLQITNNHHDGFGVLNEVSLQSPFVSHHVGGMPHRHVVTWDSKSLFSYATATVTITGNNTGNESVTLTPLGKQAENYLEGADENATPPVGPKVRLQVMRQRTLQLLLILRKIFQPPRPTMLLQ